MLKKTAWRIAVCAAAAALAALVCLAAAGRSYTVWIPLQEREREQILAGKARMEMSGPEVIGTWETEITEGYLKLRVTAAREGTADFLVTDEDGEILLLHVLRTGPGGIVADPQTGGFSGDTAVLAAVTAFCLAVCGIMARQYFSAKGPDYYAYSTIYAAGFGLFALVTGLTLARATLHHIVRPGEFTMMSAFQMIDGAGPGFMITTSPAILVFAAAMAVSNLALLRHERPRPQNVLGLAVSVLLVGGEVFGFWLVMRDFSGSEWESRVHNMVGNVYATAFAYFECMLAGSVICGLKAARHRPARDKDFILILGCWFRKDGSLPPLLRGRADRAIAFWREQKEKTGKEAWMIPSGGQGPDEPMPEAEAIARYLVEQGIPEGRIVPETGSRNTLENMAFSRKIIEGIQPGGKTVFATTNYHVFRSGLWAARAGLRAEGIGGKTKWWFWPNAFMRECAGLLAQRWRTELGLLILMMAFFAVLSLTL